MGWFFTSKILYNAYVYLIDIYEYNNDNQRILRKYTLHEIYNM